MSASGQTNSQLFVNRGSPNTYEAFTIVPQPAQGTNVVAILSLKYVSNVTALETFNSF